MFYRFIKIYILLFLIIILLLNCYKDSKLVRLDFNSRPSYFYDNNTILLSLLINKNYRLLLYNTKNFSIKWIKPPLPDIDDFIEPIFSKDCIKIAFTWFNKKLNITEICIIDTKSNNFLQVTHFNQFCRNPIFSKDAKKIYFLKSSKEKNNAGSWFYSININGTNEKKISKEGFISPGNLSITPDDKYIIFSQIYENEQTKYLENKIIKLDINTGDIITIIDNKKSLVPVVCNISNKIIYLGDNLSSADFENKVKMKQYSDIYSGIYSMDLEGKNNELLIKTTITDFYISISPDDKRLLYIFIGKIKEYNFDTNMIKEIEINQDKILSSYKKYY